MGVLSEGREGDLGEVWDFCAVQEAGKYCFHDRPMMLGTGFPMWEHFPSSAPATAQSIPGQHLVKCWDGSCSGSRFPDGNGDGDKGPVGVRLSGHQEEQPQSVFQRFVHSQARTEPG